MERSQFGGDVRLLDVELVRDVNQEAPTPAPLSEQQQVVSGLTVFTNADGVPHVAGLTSVGEVILYFREQPDGPGTLSWWTGVNLSRAHLAEQGLSTPVFADELDAFATPWGGLNIAGIDQNGAVSVLWWSPMNAVWSFDRLSDAAGADVARLCPSAVGTGRLSTTATTAGRIDILARHPEMSEGIGAGHLALYELDGSSVGWEAIDLSVGLRRER